MPPAPQYPVPTVTHPAPAVATYCPPAHVVEHDSGPACAAAVEPLFVYPVLQDVHAVAAIFEYVLAVEHVVQLFVEPELNVDAAPLYVPAAQAWNIASDVATYVPAGATIWQSLLASWLDADVPDMLYCLVMVTPAATASAGVIACVLSAFVITNLNFSPSLTVNGLPPLRYVPSAAII